jgi:hypothetical protein
MSDQRVTPPWEGAAVLPLRRQDGKPFGKVLREAKQRGHAEPDRAAAEFARTGSWPTEKRESIRRTATGWRWQEMGRYRFGQGEVRIVLRDDSQHGLVVDARQWERGNPQKAGVLIPAREVAALAAALAEAARLIEAEHREVQA